MALTVVFLGQRIHEGQPRWYHNMFPRFSSARQYSSLSRFYPFILTAPFLSQMTIVHGFKSRLTSKFSVSY